MPKTYYETYLNLPGDSADYNVLTEGIYMSASCPGATLEIGLREGGGTGVIIDALAKVSKFKTHVAIDPYGNIEYDDKDTNLKARLDYTNDMYKRALPKIFAYAAEKQINFVFYKISDMDFFKCFKDGIPVYDQERALVKQFSFVHFDGPHSTIALLNEFGNLDKWLPLQSCICFDDITHYNHDAIEKTVQERGFKLVDKTNRKALYQRHEK